MRFFEFIESNTRYYKNDSLMYRREVVNKQTLRGDLRYYNSSDFAHSLGFDSSKAFVDQSKKSIIIKLSKPNYKPLRTKTYPSVVVTSKIRSVAV